MTELCDTAACFACGACVQICPRDAIRLQDDPSGFLSPRIDPGKCVFEFEKTFGYRDLYAGVTDVICTHRHSDHYSPETVAQLEKLADEILAG